MKKSCMKLHCCREESPAEGGEGCTENCQSQPAHYHWHLHLQMKEEGHLHHRRPQPSSTHTVCSLRWANSFILEATKLINNKWEGKNRNTVVTKITWHFVPLCTLYTLFILLITIHIVYTVAHVVTSLPYYFYLYFTFLYVWAWNFVSTSSSLNKVFLKSLKSVLKN